MSRHGWPLLAAIFCAAARAQTPSPAPVPPAQQPPASNVEAPDDGLIEFLGSDDVGDAAWWEFLKRAPPRRYVPPPSPPQDAKK
jgi:hypothetical protein